MKRKNQKVVIISTFVIILVVIVIVLSLVFNNQMQKTKKQYSEQLQEAQMELASNYKTVYVAIKKITKGDTIKKGVVEQQQIISSADASLFITEEDLNKKSVITVDAGTPILKSMVGKKIQDDIREKECSFIWLNTNMVENDFVDIRIIYPNGEDYIVVSNKPLKNLDLANNNVFFWLTEEELLNLDSAIVDASIHTGAKIYVTKYVEPSTQKAATPNYNPSIAIIDLIYSDPNVVQSSARTLSKVARKAMEERLEDFSEEHPELKSIDQSGTKGVSGTVGVTTTPTDGVQPTTDTDISDTTINESTPSSTDATINESTPSTDTEELTPIEDTDTSSSSSKFDSDIVLDGGSVDYGE